MSKSVIDIVKEKIIARHQGDDKQLEVIFSPANRLLVEAPAGYGKTNTMVSKIAYMIATKQIPNPKRLLALTFSVNAAYKIKKDVTQQVPLLLAETGLDIATSDKIFVSNYHGFSRSVLKKYGAVFHSKLKSIDTLHSIDDSDVKNTQTTVSGLSYEDALFLSEFCDALKKGYATYLEANLERYCAVIIKDLLPQGFISYNAILTLTQLLFKTHPNVLNFYTKYYSTLLVDEYQDTNILSFEIIKSLIAAETKVILLGDSLQRIYGFIGAVENLLTISEHQFGLTKIQLSKNYRFASNPEMLRLDNNIRRNAENTDNPDIKEDAVIKLDISETQADESLNIVKFSLAILKKYPESKVAILVKQRGQNVNSIIKTFELNKIPYFYGLFTDEDVNYLSFHRKCLYVFIELIRLKESITKKVAKEHISIITKHFSESSNSLIEALISLLDIFWNKLFLDFSFLSIEEKINLIKDTFEHNGLKQYIEFINTNIIISTVHAAKGLEWEYVILPDMEQDSFPNWFGLCNSCKCKKDCNIIITSENESKFLEELSVFYVAVTRARKQVFFTASKKEAKGYNKNLSCFLKLPGITIK
ncbi:MAG: ATP-dependent helicase [bacterium]|nr:ATP-dependent helicase [bacterium]